MRPNRPIRGPVIRRCLRRNRCSIRKACGPEGLGGMRILIVSQYFHPENFRVNQLATALRAGGHDIVVLTGQPNYPTGRFFPGYGSKRTQTEHWNGIEIVRVPILARGAGRGWQLALNYLSFAISATVFG